MLKQNNPQTSRDEIYTISEMKNIPEQTDSRLDTAEKNMSNPEDIAVETIQNEKKKLFLFNEQYQ